IVPSELIPEEGRGNHIVVLGVCEGNDASKVVLRGLRLPAGYLRQVPDNVTASCPKHAESDPVKEQSLVKAITENPKSESALYAYARFLEAEGRFEDAKVQVKKVLELNPKHAEALALERKINVLITE